MYQKGLPVRQAGFAPILILVGILIITLVVAGAYYLGKTQITPKSQQPVAILQTPQPSPTPDPTADWKTYTSEDKSFSFKYPPEWGDYKEEVNDAVKERTGDSGKTYSLIFVNETKVSGAGKSADYTAGRGGSWSDYNGDSQKPKGVTSFIYTGLPGCDLMYSYQSFSGYIQFNLPGKEISGVILEIPILSEADGKKYETPLNETKLCESGSDEEKEAKMRGNEILDKINKGQIDGESKRNLDIFNQILQTFKFLP